MANSRHRSEQRPLPDALLDAARREEGRAGQLRIFVGAAPGVGKTYEMLQSAHALKKDGYDVVIGTVGGKTLERAFTVLRRGGRLVTTPGELCKATNAGSGESSWTALHRSPFWPPVCVNPKSYKSAYRRTSTSTNPVP